MEDESQNLTERLGGTPKPRDTQAIADDSQQNLWPLSMTVPFSLWEI